MSVVCYCQSREMICNNILHPLFILDLQVEFLKEENPSNKPSLGIFLGEKVLQSRMVCEDDDVRPHQVCTKFVQGIDYCQQLFLSGGIIPPCFIQRFACIVYDIRFPLFSLTENCSDGKMTSIAHNLKR